MRPERCHHLGGQHGVRVRLGITSPTSGRGLALRASRFPTGGASLRTCLLSTSLRTRRVIPYGSSVIVGNQGSGDRLPGLVVMPDGGGHRQDALAGSAWLRRTGWPGRRSFTSSSSIFTYSAVTRVS